MKPAAFIALAKTVGFDVIDERDDLFTFQAVGFHCVGFLYTDPKSSSVISLQLYVGFTLNATDEQINDWNRDFRFVKAYQSAPNGVAFEMDMLIPERPTAETLKEAWRIWNQIIVRIGVRFE